MTAELWGPRCEYHLDNSINSAWKCSALREMPQLVSKPSANQPSKLNVSQFRYVWSSVAKSKHGLIILNAGFYHTPCWVAENVSQNTNVCPQLPIPCHDKLKIVIHTVWVIELIYGTWRKPDCFEIAIYVESFFKSRKFYFAASFYCQPNNISTSQDK